MSLNYIIIKKNVEFFHQSNSKNQNQNQKSFWENLFTLDFKIKLIVQLDMC
jgi:hypothetical protein